MAGIQRDRAGTIFTRTLHREGMEMGKFKGIICAAAIAAMGVAANGCDEEEDDVVVAGTQFDVIDTSNDGLVSAAEWNATYDVWDVNGDGIVNQNEWLLDDGFGDLDADANAALTEAEWNSAMVNWDLDDDGFLEPNEMFF